MVTFYAFVMEPLGSDTKQVTDYIDACCCFTQFLQVSGWITL